MNDKKPLVDFRSAPKLQTSLMLSGALIGFFGAQDGITVLTVLGIVLILASGAVWSLYYRCPHCGEQLGRDRYLKYCPHCGRSLDAPVEWILQSGICHEYDCIAPGESGSFG